MSAAPAAKLSAYFDTLYRDSDDPWSVRQRWYEERKRSLVLAALPQPRYGRAFEPACGNGELTPALAARCDELLASDSTKRAVELARARVRHLPHVRIAHQVMPGDWPAEKFDLIVLSEVAYFLDAATLHEVVKRSVASLTAEGCLLACDWKRDFAERVLPTGAAHAAFHAIPELKQTAQYQDDDFLLEIWSPDGRSVAQREGFA